MSWNRLNSEEILKNLVEDSKVSPLIIFKHSTRCPTSAMAFDRMNRSWDDIAMDKISRYYLDVIADRAISNYVAEYFSIQHESPQVLVIWDGQCVYDNSHLGISYQDIKEKIDALAPAN